MAADLREHASRARIAGEFLKVDDIAPLSKALLIGSTICRRLLEEGRHGKLAFDRDEFHCAESHVQSLIELDKREIHLNGCWTFDKDSKLKQNCHFTEEYYKIFSQILHSLPLQLHKTPDGEEPCFWVGSEDRTTGKAPAKLRFYRIYWSSYADYLDEFRAVLEA